MEVRSLDLTVPEGCREGDQLKFRTVVGPYALLVPPGVSPGRKLQVTVTVPAGFSKPLLVQGLTVNGSPVSTGDDNATGPVDRRKFIEAANKCIGLGQEVMQVYLKEEEPPGPIVGNPRWINGRMSIQPKDSSAFAQLRAEQELQKTVTQEGATSGATPPPIKTHISSSQLRGD